MPRRWLGTAGLVIAIAGCASSPPAPRPAPPPRSASAVAAATVAALPEAAPAAASAPAPPWHVTGEVPTAEPDRGGAIEALAVGEPSASELPERSTDPGVPVVRDLAEQLAPFTYVEEPAAPPSPRIRVGSAKVAGKLPPEVIQRIVRQSFGLFRLCYEIGLKRNARLMGEVVIDFTIEAKGTVIRADSGGDLPDRATIYCVTRAFWRMSFPQPESGVVRVGLPIHFAPR